MSAIAIALAAYAHVRLRLMFKAPLERRETLPARSTVRINRDATCFCRKRLCGEYYEAIDGEYA